MPDWVAKVMGTDGKVATFEGLNGQLLPEFWLQLLDDHMPDPLRPPQHVIDASRAFWKAGGGDQPRWSINDGKGNSVLSYLPPAPDILAQNGLQAWQLGGSITPSAARVLQGHYGNLADPALPAAGSSVPIGWVLAGLGGLAVIALLGRRSK